MGTATPARSTWASPRGPFPHAANPAAPSGLAAVYRRRQPASAYEYPVTRPCYTLDEVMAEKMRAVLGQRIHAISRDVYDISFLRGHVHEEGVLRALPQKLAAREVKVQEGDVDAWPGVGRSST